MGLDPSVLHLPHIARLMSPEDRQAAWVTTPEEAASAQAAEYEADLQRLCELDLHREGIEYIHLSPRAREKAGWPDLTFVLPQAGPAWAPPRPGIPYAVELKAKNGRLSADQEATLKRMAMNGWRTAVVRDHAAFRAILAKHKEQNPQPKATP